MRLMWVIVGLISVALVVVQPATADPTKACCPNGTDWELMSVEEAAAAIWPYLVDKSPWEGQTDFQESGVRPYDKGGDGDVCLKTVAQSNPNGNWFGVPLFITRDNSANAG